MSLRLVYFIAVFAVAYVSGENRAAIAHLVSQNATGSIMFTETAEGLRVSGSITGLRNGSYGFHVHEFGDTSNCDATGRHFNPGNTTHGDREHQVRHVGDLGNVVFVGNENGVATLNYVDRMITLRGRNSILGRALVLHEGKDDLGQGGNEASLQNGNAGPRVACGVIGIRYPADPWNSAVSFAPSVLLSLVAALFVFGSI